VKAITRDRHSLYLLIALLAFLILTPFLEHRAGGELLLLILMYAVLVTAALKLSERGALLWPGVVLVSVSAVLMALSHLFPSAPLMIANYSVLTVFLGIVSVGLFNFLGRPGSITAGHIYASVSLYLLLSMLWYAIYNLVDTVAPGSFIEASGAVTGIRFPHSSFQYFSLVTLTTLGYGDILPVTPVARMFSGLEAATGVLYIAITVARLVAAYQSSPPN
jgi:hypothetical protein